MPHFPADDNPPGSRNPPPTLAALLPATLSFPEHATYISGGENPLREVDEAAAVSTPSKEDVHSWGFPSSRFPVEPAPNPVLEPRGPPNVGAPRWP